MSRICPSWLSFILYNPVRKAFTDREKILDESCITGESVVLEIGPGNGFFTEAIAKRAKAVVSVELQAGMTRKLKRRIQELSNKVTVITGDIATEPVGENFADVCILYYSFHEIQCKSEAADNIGRAVKANGVLAIYEPTIEVRKKMMDATVQLFEKKGLKLKSERAGLFTRFALLRKLQRG